MPLKPIRWISGLAIGALALGLAGCGSDDEDPPLTAPPATATTATSGAAPSGTPIKLMNIIGLTGPVTFPEVPVSMRAAAKMINDAGGVNGRPIEILVCDEKGGDVNAAADCARKAVQEKVTAVVGGTGATGGSIMPIIEAAGIPDVASQPSSQAQTTSPLSFPITSLALGFTAGANILKAAGATDVQFVGPNNPAYTGLVKLTESLLPQVGITLKGNTLYPATATDFTQFAASAYGSGASGYYPILTSRGTFPSFVKAVNDSGETFGEAPTVLNGAVFQPSVLEDKLKDQINGVYVLNSGQTPTDTSLPGIKAYHDAVEAAGEETEYTDTGLQGFVGVNVIADLLKKQTGDVTSPAVLVEAMKAAGPISYPGWTSFDWSKPALPEPLAANFPRYFNTTFWVSKIVDNKLVSAVSAPIQFAAPIQLTVE